MWINKVASLSIADQETLVKGVLEWWILELMSEHPGINVAIPINEGLCIDFGWMVVIGYVPWPMIYVLQMRNYWEPFQGEWNIYGLLTQISLGYMARVFFFFF